MPEIATQTEIKDTHRNVSTQCGETKGLVTSVIVEYYAMKEINARPRKLTNRKKAPAVRAGIKISEANTNKTKKMTHRKCVGTDGWMPEEDEVIILKEINNIGQGRKPMRPLPTLKRKVSAKQGNLSRQEKLYADILANEMSSIKRKRTKEVMEKENEGNKRDKREQIKEERRKTQKRNEEQE